MNLYAISLILFGIVLIIFPDIVAYLLAVFLIFTGINILLLGNRIKTKKTGVKVGKFKVVKE